MVGFIKTHILARCHLFIFLFSVFFLLFYILYIVIVKVSITAVLRSLAPLPERTYCQPNMNHKNK